MVAHPKHQAIVEALLELESARVELEAADVIVDAMLLDTPVAERARAERRAARAKVVAEEADRQVAAAVKAAGFVLEPAHLCSTCGKRRS